MTEFIKGEKDVQESLLLEDQKKSYVEKIKSNALKEMKEHIHSIQILIS